MGLAVDPSFATNRRIYACFLSNAPGGLGDIRLVLAALVLNTAMAQGEYERQGLQGRLSDSTQSLQAIDAQLERATSPEALAAAARALGMVPVPASQGGYLRLSDGAVLGNPTPAGSGG